MREAAVLDVRTALHRVAQGLDHPECVAWWDDAIWCGTEGGELLRIDPSTGRAETIASPGGLILGICFDGRGRCLMCDAGGGRLLRVTIGGATEVLVEAVAGRRLTSPNFAAFDPRGRLWVSESGSSWTAGDGFLFRVEPDGEAVMVDDTCRFFPNGLAIAADAETLWLVESGSRSLLTRPLGDDSAAATRRIELPADTVPDGIAFGRDGTLYIGCWRPDRVYQVGASGEIEVLLDDPTGEFLTTATNLCFGAADSHHLYIAGLGGWAISRVDVGRPGLPLHQPTD